MKRVIIAFLITFTPCCVSAMTMIYDDGETHEYNMIYPGSVSILDSTEGNPTILNVTGGSLRYNFNVFQSSTCNIFDGVYDSLHVGYKATGNVYGGVASEPLKNNSYGTLNIYAGTNAGVSGYDESITNIIGGNINGQVIAEDNSQIYITGGATYNSLFGWESGRIIIYGQNFNYSFGEVSDRAGIITGTTLDGTTSMFYTFELNDNSQIILVPEPTSIMLLALGGLLIRKR